MNKRYDFYDDTGAWLDSCEASQVGLDDGVADNAVRRGDGGRE